MKICLGIQKMKEKKILILFVVLHKSQLKLLPHKERNRKI
jgi:hypothetical protein